MTIFGGLRVSAVRAFGVKVEPAPVVSPYITAAFGGLPFPRRKVSLPTARPPDARSLALDEIPRSILERFARATPQSDSQNFPVAVNSPGSSSPRAGRAR